MKRLSLRSAAGVVCLAVAAMGTALLWHGRATSPFLLLVPMINVFDACSNPEIDPPTIGECNLPGGSAAKLMESTLSRLGPRVSPNGRFELGYTLQFPLLRLFKREGDAWVIDQPVIERMVRTLHDNDRPAIVYLFSTHFGLGAPIEPVLAADPRNLAVTPAGPMLSDKFYDHDIYPWAFSTIDNELTRRREQAVKAVVDEICRLPQQDREKIRGVTLLGELHHLFPNFQAGMGFQEKYLVSDYSRASIDGFRAFLAARFGTVEALNKQVVADYPSFAAVDPPSKDIRTQPLARYTEHIDSYAHGTLPISGWLHASKQRVGDLLWVRIYRNGEFVERVRVNLSRQDVFAAHPEFGTADVGWRFDLDYTRLTPGVHRLDAILEGFGKPWVHLDTRYIAVMDRTQSTPREMPAVALPKTVFRDASVTSYVDLPADRSAYYYNPLVPLWHRFRGSQVVAYLSHFDRLVRDSCLANVDTYIHQITPFTNPSWDANKFAVDASLKLFDRARLGVSLYGEPTYGVTFFDWYERSKLRTYGVTEFHPLRPMSFDEARAMFEHHRESGAQFVSFFLKTQKLQGAPSGDPYLFAFDPANPRFSSDRMYDTVKALVNE